MKVLIIFLLINNLNSSYSKVLSTFYPIRLERQSNEDDTVEEYLLDIGNKYHHAVLKADEYMKIPLTFSINGEDPKLYYHDYKCFKKGYIKNSYKSRVVLNDCEGLRGIFNVDNNTFFVKPSEKYENERFQKQLTSEKLDSIEHVLETFEEHDEEYECKVSESEAIVSQSLDTERQIKYSDPHFSLDLDSRSETRVVEISLIILSETLKAYFNNVDRVFKAMTMASYYTNYFLNEMNVVPLIMHIEIFKDENPYGPINSNSFGPTSGILRAISKYRQEYFKPRGLEYDVTYLLSHEPYGGAIGYAYIGGFCRFNYSVMYALVTNSEVHAVSITHELGHLFGFRHTNPNNEFCKCEKICIMNARSSRREYYKSSWSNCEREKLKTIMNYPCLKNFNKNKVPVDPIYCGNGIIDIGEECDCGHPSDCAKTELIHCCDPVTCRIYPGKTCVQGRICTYCKEVNITEKLSPSIECFEADCDGTVDECEKKRILPFGHSCGNKDVCQLGKCQKFQSICEEYFGTELANDICFEEFNSRGDETGNCGTIDPLKKIYIPCTTKEDQLCGKIVCKINQNFQLSNIVSSSIINNTCGVLYEENSNKISSFMVPNGSSCGKNKICYNNKCYNKSVATSLFTENKCGQNAVLNQKGECIYNDEFVLKSTNGCNLKSNYKIGKFSFIIMYISIEILIFFACFFGIGIYLWRERYDLHRRINLLK